MGEKYILEAIGKIEEEGEIVKIQLLDRLGRALKYLSDFSHVILIYSSEEIEYPFSEAVAEIQGVDQNTATLSVIGADELRQGQVVYDIKPYFPCEDRVNEGLDHRENRLDLVEYPNKLRCLYEVENGVQRSKAEVRRSETTDLRGQEARRMITQKHQVYDVGEIRQIQGAYYLVFDPEVKVNFEAFHIGSYMKVVWWFNRYDKPKYRLILECDPPYENAPRTGVFATRSPVRPNPIALTTVPVIEVDASLNRIRVGKMDCFDHTPLIECKPYDMEKDCVSSFVVPKWLSHWPEWIEAGQEAKAAKPGLSVRTSLMPYLRGTEEQCEKTKYQGTKCQRILAKAERLSLQTFSKENALQQEQHRLEDTNIKEVIVIKGARQNNLKNIDLTIPYEKLTVVTGVSGSGKSSLVFDTLYAESQRRLIGSFGSTGLGEFLERPEVDDIYGLLPAVAVSQKHIRCQPRSTVGTLTGISNQLRKLFAYVGIRHCPYCKSPIEPMSQDEILRCLLQLKPGLTVTIRPFQADELMSSDKKKGDSQKQSQVGITQVVTKDQAVDGLLEKSFIIGKLAENELNTLLQKSLERGKGAIEVEIQHEMKVILQTTQKCYHCDHILFELTPAAFSFNDPESMCLVCKGLGTTYEVDEKLIIENEDLSILDGASSVWGNLRKFREKPNANWMKGEILGLAQKMKVDLEKPWKELPHAFKEAAIWGTKGEEVTFRYENSTGRSGEITRPVEGAYHIIERLHAAGNSAAVDLENKYMKQTICPACNGERLNEEGRNVTIGQLRYPDVAKMSLTAVGSWVSSLENELSASSYQLAAPLIEPIQKQAKRLGEVGVAYLQLDRSAQTLSGGELQRIRFTSLFENGMSHMLYILDEPTSGLHKRDKEKLICLLKQLIKAHHTIVAVEHDRQMMLEADYLVDIGPGAGSEGGHLVTCGSPIQVMERKSITGPYLKHMIRHETLHEEDLNQKSWMVVKRANAHNLKDIEVRMPLGTITCITGVSGSGKSSLVSGVIYPEIAHYLQYGVIRKKLCQEIEGVEKIQQIVEVSQKPIGRSSRSNPATYTGIMDDIRRLFANTEEAIKRGYKLAHFSFNSKEGQCSQCKGEGRISIEAMGMADLWHTCSVCKGKRYKKEILEVKMQGKRISDVLEMSISEAKDFFQEDQSLKSKLGVLEEVGLGYLKLGQSATTLSGGEAQRLKLAAEFCSNRMEEQQTSVAPKRCLYLLDEPSTGLHFKDIENLLRILRKITQQGHSVLMIEHHEDMIRNSDWVIELGPDGGENGGTVLFQGTSRKFELNSDR